MQHVCKIVMEHLHVSWLNIGTGDAIGTDGTISWSLPDNLVVVGLAES